MEDQMTHFKSFSDHHPFGKRKRIVPCIFQLLIILCLSTHAPAQTKPAGDFPSPGYPRGELPPLLETEPTEPLPGLVLPPEPPESDLKKVPVPDEAETVRVKKIIVTGSTVFSDDQIRQVTSPYLDRALTNEILEEIRHALTVFYIQNGYINSGAVIPDQTVSKGTITFKIIEGSLSQIDVKGNQWFRETYIQSRLDLEQGLPLNINAVQTRLRLLQQDHRISQIQAELKPGIDPGDSLLNVKVEEKNPFQVQLGFDNYQSPSVGGERGLATLIHQNLTGRGDILNLNSELSEGNDPQFDVWYSLPINAHDTNLAFRYSTNDLDVRETDFQDLDITSKSDVFQITLSHPFYRTLAQEFSMSVTGEYNKHRTYLLGESFSFSPGVEDGEAINTVLRFSQEWTHRTQNQVIAARSKFSFGINALGSTSHSGDLPDSQFVAWLGQVQWARILPVMNTQLIFRTDLQLSSDSLLGLEQISVGGRHTVRGYRENQILRDQAMISSLEARIPLIRDKGITEYLQVAVFVDYGNAWNKNFETSSPRSISSVGLGLRWAGFLKKTPFMIRPKCEIYWGHALTDVDTPDNDLQDDGIHFQFVLQNFY